MFGNTKEKSPIAEHLRTPFDRPSKLLACGQVRIVVNLICLLHDLGTHWYPKVVLVKLWCSGKNIFESDFLSCENLSSQKYESTNGVPLGKPTRSFPIIYGLVWFGGKRTLNFYCCGRFTRTPPVQFAGTLPAQHKRNTKKNKVRVKNSWDIPC